MRHVAATFAVALALTAVPHLALAQSDEDRSLARAMGQEGQDALDKKDFRTAEDRFKRAVRVFDDAKAPVPPTLLLGFARAAAGNGHLIGAQEAYNRLVRTGTPPGAPQVFVNAVEDAKKEIDPVSARVPKATITVTGCDNPHVTLDDVAMSNAALGIKRPVDPGTHTVKATADGCKPGEASFTVDEGKETEAPIKLEKAGPAAVTPPPVNPPPVNPPPANPPPGNPPPGADQGTGGGSVQKTLGFVSLGVGGVGLIAGTITGVLAMGKNNDLKAVCPNGICGADQQSNVDSYKTMGAISTAGFIVGGVGVVAGLVLIFTAPKATPKTAWIRPYVGLGVLGAAGAF
ncbi:MAG TPA: hypothetical protein VF316_17865 [Polyangiaceae bacterium]